MRRVVAYPALLTILGLVLACMGLTWPIVLVGSLALGWATFSIRVAPGVRIDPGGVAIGLTCLVLFAAVAHSFFGWLYRQVRGVEKGPGWSVRWTASLVAGVVLMFTAGIAAAGMAHQVGWLLTAKDPWIARHSTAMYRVQSAHNLRQIGLAISNYDSSQETMPPGATLDAEGRLHHGWQARLLPYMEQTAVFNQINFNVPWDDSANSTAMRTRINVYLHPANRDEPNIQAPAPSHYAANAWLMGGDSTRKLASIPDGMSTTILVGEAAGEYKPWGHPANWRDPAQGVNRTPAGFGGPSPGGANFLMADGHVQFLNNSIDPKVFRALSTPAGGEAVKPDDY